MASQLETYYPPYEGKEPYIHLCFSDRDERKIRPLLRRLLLRGCRTWYCTGKAPDREEQLSRRERMLGAGLTVLFLTEAVRRDTDLKNLLLVCQDKKQPILILDTDGGDRGLSVGITRAYFTTVLGGNAPDAFDAILHGRGFSQVFLGPPLPVFERALTLKRIRTILLVLTLLVAAGVGVYKYLHPPKAPDWEDVVPEPEDQVLIENDYLREVARAAVGGGIITEEGLSKVETLYLDQLPESAAELAVFPNLKDLVLSQAAAQKAPSLPELYDSYTLTLGGE